MLEQKLSQANQWAQRDTTVDAIEQQLAGLLRAFSEPTAEPGSHPPPRASVLNLVVWATTERQLGEALADLEALAGRHPSRTIALLVGPPDAQSSIDAEVTGQCLVRPHDAGRVCFDLVRLTVRGEMTEHLDTVVEPLLLHDLPTYLWWLGDPPVPAEPMLRIAQRLIVDAAAFSEPVRGLGALEALGEVGVGDLTWGRLAPWRELLAQFFDPADTRPLLRKIDRVEVHFAEGHIVGPLLLVGWLAQALGWRPTRPFGDPWAPLEFRGPEGVLTVRFARGAFASAPPDGLLYVALHARAADAQFIIGRATDEPLVSTSALLKGRPPVHRSAVMPPDTMAALLRRELDHPRADASLHRTLKMLRALAGAKRVDSSGR